MIVIIHLYFILIYSNLKMYYYVLSFLLKSYTTLQINKQTKKISIANLWERLLSEVFLFLFITEILHKSLPHISTCVPMIEFFVALRFSCFKNCNNVMHALLSLLQSTVHAVRITAISCWTMIKLTYRRKIRKPSPLKFRKNNFLLE